jgi:hypothetical protein
MLTYLKSFFDSAERLLALTVLMVALLGYLWGWWFGADIAYPSAYITSLYESSFEYLQGKKAGIDIRQQMPSFLLEGRYVSKGLVISEWANIWMALTIALSFALLFTVFSFFEGFYSYFVLAATLAWFTVGQTESLALFGIEKKWIDIAVGTAFAGVVYWFQAFHTHRGVLFRFWVFLSIFAFYFLLISFFSDLQNPFFTWVNTGFWTLAIVAILFVTINGVDIQLWLLKQLASQKNTTGNLVPFLLFSFFYLGNLLWLYLENIGQVAKGIVTISPFIIFILAGAAGWVVAKDKHHYWEHIGISAGVGWLLQQVAFALTAAATGYVYWLGSDPWVEVFEDIFTLGYFCTGAIFIMYVLINYGGMLLKGLAVYLVIFKPRYMPYAAVAVFALAAMWIFVLNASYFPYYQAVAGQYQLKADAAIKEGDHFLAESYLQTSRTFEYRNHRTNYTLGWLYKINGNDEKALQSFKSAVVKKPTVQAYLSWSEIAGSKGNTIEAMLALKEGMQAFPNNSMLCFNLALTFGKMGFADSVEVYLTKSKQLGIPTSEIASTYIFLSALRGWDIELADDLKNKLSGSASAYNNQLFDALRSGNHVLQTDMNMLRKTQQNADEYFAILYNNALYHAFSGKDDLLPELNEQINKETDERKKNYLKFAKALTLYYQNKKHEALLEIEQTAEQENAIAGIYAGLLLQENNYQQSQYIYEKLWAKGYMQTLMPLAALYAINGNAQKSAERWVTLFNLPTPKPEGITLNLVNVLQQGETEKIGLLLNNEQFFALLALRQQLSDETYLKWVATIGENDYGRTLLAVWLDDKLQKNQFMALQNLKQTSFYRWFKHPWLQPLLLHYQYLTDGIAAAKETAKSASADWQKYLTAIAGSDTTAAHTAYISIREHIPYDPWIYHYYSQHLEQAGYTFAAYEHALYALNLMPKSFLLNRDYIKYCMLNGLTDFAQQRIESLSGLYSDTELQQLRAFQNNILTTNTPLTPLN